MTQLPASGRSAICSGPCNNAGKRCRYRCGECGKTFSSTKGTPYYRLQHRRATFDGVVALRVEGVSISSISRIKGIARNTVARWLEKAAQVCRRFNHRRIAGFAAEELQADEIRTFAGNKKTPSWVFVTIEVWSRLWPSTVTGRRSYGASAIKCWWLPRNPLAC